MLFSRVTKPAVASLLLIIGFAAPVHAQQNNPVVSGTFYEDRAVSSSLSTDQLVLTFAQTPANQFLNITNVSCAVTTDTVEVMSVMILYSGTTSGSKDLNRPYSIKGNATFETLAPTKYYSIVQNGIFYKVGASRFPSIEIDTVSNGASAITANCVIVGNLTDKP
jgi:hypothetical protein